MLCGCKLHMWNASLHQNCSSGSLKASVYDALCHRNSCDSWPSQSNGGGKKKRRNNKTFTKAPANVKSLLTLLPRSPQVCRMIEKSQHYSGRSPKHTNILNVCRCVQCPEKTPASPWPRVSTFSHPRWTQQETASQAKTAVRGTHEHMNEDVVIMWYRPQSRLKLETWLDGNTNSLGMVWSWRNRILFHAFWAGLK